MERPKHKVREVVSSLEIVFEVAQHGGKEERLVTRVTKAADDGGSYIFFGKRKTKLDIAVNVSLGLFMKQCRKTRA